MAPLATKAAAGETNELTSATSAGSMIKVTSCNVASIA
jgi:hypothetical protein